MGVGRTIELAVVGRLLLERHAAAKPAASHQARRYETRRPTACPRPSVRGRDKNKKVREARPQSGRANCSRLHASRHEKKEEEENG